ncbi:ATP-dependent dsDNA exonuclease [Vibrio diabolicus]|uniref:ATP-dependent dsDNA exonuclease n=1 Tax=Vibrio diabolicus TaxID=50719 RepID=UPI00215F82E0|nr:ATP-dependent dsDNA exonuclease [Vibrio diabolicus]MCS0381021.1 ATP-dependent dsDNA exonuclease [Vibrio diabolicus]MCS0420325.1 ATP-dependent dsDNA exonuclease [Vibrio diabolicus]MCS0432319.1 ATP-dependent dsDNA exonuclease [Vibrio diabolicus]
MKKIALIIMSAIMAGMMFLTFSQDGQQEAAVSASAPKTKNKNVPSTSLKTSNIAPSAEASPQTAELPSATQITTERLTQLKGRKLVAELETFWHECMLNRSCEEQIALFEAHLSSARFQLLANYPQLSSQWQESVGNLLFDEQQSLASRIAQLKNEARSIWGELADVVFADEFALYDFNLEAQKLNTQSPDNFLRAFEQLTIDWQEHADAIGLTSDREKYERAVTLIPNSMSFPDRQTIIAELQKTYLTKDESEEIHAREQQIAEQKEQVRDYQQALQQLESRLRKERATSHAGLSDPEWQSYYQQEIADFRREFFSS